MASFGPSRGTAGPHDLLPVLCTLAGYIRCLLLRAATIAPRAAIAIGPLAATGPPHHHCRSPQLATRAAAAEDKGMAASGGGRGRRGQGGGRRRLEGRWRLERKRSERGVSVFEWKGRMVGSLAGSGLWVRWCIGVDKIEWL